MKITPHPFVGIPRQGVRQIKVCSSCGKARSHPVHKWRKQ